MNKMLKTGILLLIFLSVWITNQAQGLKILVPVPSDSISITASSEFHQGDARLVIDGNWKTLKNGDKDFFIIPSVNVTITKGISVR